MSDTYEQVRDAIRRNKRYLMQLRAKPSVPKTIGEKLAETAPMPPFMFYDSKVAEAVLRVEIEWHTLDKLMCSRNIDYGALETLRAGRPMSIEGVRIYPVDFRIPGGFDIINPFGKAP